MTTPSTEELTELLEKAARIIDPGIWATRDYRASLDEPMMEHVNRALEPSLSKAAAIFGVTSLPGLLAENDKLKADNVVMAANKLSGLTELRSQLTEAEAEVGRLKRQLDNANKLWSPRIAMMEARAEAAEASLKVMVEDAERWQAFISSDRFYVMGSAGFSADGSVRADLDPQDWLHFTLNVWDKHSAGNDQQGQHGRALLLAYVEHRRRLNQPPTAEAKLSALGGGEPVAWRVKDFADGWFFYGLDQQAEATRAECDGFLVQPLYPSTPTNPWRPTREALIEVINEHVDPGLMADAILSLPAPEEDR